MPVSRDKLKHIKVMVAAAKQDDASNFEAALNSLIESSNVRSAANIIETQKENGETVYNAILKHGAIACFDRLIEAKCYINSPHKFEKSVLTYKMSTLCVARFGQLNFLKTPQKFMLDLIYEYLGINTAIDTIVSNLKHLSPSTITSFILKLARKDEDGNGSLAELVALSQHIDIESYIQNQSAEFIHAITQHSKRSLSPLIDLLEKGILSSDLTKDLIKERYENPSVKPLGVDSSIEKSFLLLKTIGTLFSKASNPIMKDLHQTLGTEGLYDAIVEHELLASNPSVFSQLGVFLIGQAIKNPDTFNFSDTADFVAEKLRGSINAVVKVFYSKPIVIERFGSLASLSCSYEEYMFIASNVQKIMSSKRDYAGKESAISGYVSGLFYMAGCLRYDSTPVYTLSPEHDDDPEVYINMIKFNRNNYRGYEVLGLLYLAIQRCGLGPVVQNVTTKSDLNLIIRIYSPMEVLPYVKDNHKLRNYMLSKMM